MDVEPIIFPLILILDVQKCVFDGLIEINLFDFDLVQNINSGKETTGTDSVIIT